MPNESTGDSGLLPWVCQLHSIHLQIRYILSPDCAVEEAASLGVGKAMGGKRETQSLLSSVPLEGLKVPAAFRGGTRDGGSLLPLHPHSPSELSRHE